MNIYLSKRKERSNVRGEAVAISLDPVYICAYNMTVNYQAALTIEDDDPHEQRFVTIGMDALGGLLVVVYTWRGDELRVISARKATGRERKQYGGSL